MPALFFSRTRPKSPKQDCDRISARRFKSIRGRSVTVEAGNIATDPDPPFNMFNFDGFPGYRIYLLAGSTVLGSDNNSLLPLEGQFLTSTFDVTIGSSHANFGQGLAIRLVNLNGVGTEVNFDNVRIVATPVPEPTGMMLAVSAAIAVGWLRRRAALHQ